MGKPRSQAARLARLARQARRPGSKAAKRPGKPASHLGGGLGDPVQNGAASTISRA